MTTSNECQICKKPFDDHVLPPPSKAWRPVCPPTKAK